MKKEFKFSFDFPLTYTGHDGKILPILNLEVSGIAYEYSNNNFDFDMDEVIDGKTGIDLMDLFQTDQFLAVREAIEIAAVKEIKDRLADQAIPDFPSDAWAQGSKRYYI